MLIVTPRGIRARKADQHLRVKTGANDSTDSGYGDYERSGHDRIFCSIIEDNTTMTLIWYILVGFAAGALAKLITPQKESAGFLLTTLLGIAGAVVGGFLGGLIGLTPESLIGELITATAGAVVLLWAWHKFKK